MAINTNDQLGAGWGKGGNPDPSLQPGQPQPVIGSGLANLISGTSILSNQRNIRYVDEILEIIDKKKKTFESQSLTSLQKALLPRVMSLTSDVSSSLPGLSLSTTYGGTLYFMPVLFINEALNTSNEDITMMSNHQTRKVSMRYPSVNFLNGEIIESLSRKYKSDTSNGPISKTVTVSAMVIDIDQYRGSEAYGTDSLSELFANNILTQWESGVLVTGNNDAVNAGLTLPSPFVHGTPYGTEKRARITLKPTHGQVQVKGELLASNLEIRMTTDQSNNNGSTANLGKDIVTTLATVELVVSNPAQAVVQGGYVGTGPNGQPIRYTPLQAVVSMNAAIGGDMLGENTSIQTYLMGLYSLLTTNSNYQFTEPLRAKEVGNRGNLTNMELRVDALLETTPLFAMRDVNKKMTDKKLIDTDFVSAWIRENVNQYAMYAVDLIGFGNNSAINNFLLHLGGADPIASKKANIALVGILDSMTDNNFSKKAKENLANNKGWKPGDRVLHPSRQIRPHGIFQYNQKWVSMNEIDEMFITKLYGKDRLKADEYLSLIYGGNPACQNDRIRKYEIRQRIIELSDGQFFLNGYSERFWWDPSFMATMVEAFSAIGNVSVAGTMGMYAATPMAYAETDYVTRIGLAGTVGGDNKWNNGYPNFMF